MSDTQLIAIKLDLKYHLDAMKQLCSDLTTQLMDMPDITEHLFAIGQDREGRWRQIDHDVAVKRLNIFSTFTYRVDQDPKESIKFPAVIQLHPYKHASILALIHEINVHKDALHDINQTLKIMLKKGSAEVWQDMLCYCSIIQILRHVSCLERSVDYLGLSYMTKPVVNSMTREKALNYIDKKIQHYLGHNDYLSRLPFLDEVRRQIDTIDERHFDIKLARKGAPRIMLNAKAGNETYQIMASMPAFVFSPHKQPVSVPSGIKRKPRSDKRIPIGGIKSDFGLYLIPKVG